MPSPALRYSIGVAARRSGLKPDLIRAWERRHGAIEPERTETRRRGYTDDDIERLRLLRLAVVAGHSIGRIAQQPIESLRELAREAEEIPPPVRPNAKTPEAEAILEACLDAVVRLDAADLERQLGTAARSLSNRRLIQEILAPLLQRVGELWHNGTLRPAHEHLASAAVRSLLGELRKGTPRDPTAPLLLVTTPARQHHELGALMASAAASDEGWRVVFLGADLPAEEIAGAAELSGARAVALSLTYPPDDPQLADELRRLRRHLPKTPIIVGGQVADDYAAPIGEIQALRASDFDRFRALLGELRHVAP